MILVKIAIILVIGYLLMASGWLMLITLASWLFRAKLVRNSEPLKLLVVIPAHNEALQIGMTVENTRKCEYPQELLDIAVIADNCTDNTAEVAAISGARVYARNNKHERGKGAALDWFLKGYRERLQEYGGIVFIDADSCPDRQMFKALSQSLSSPGVEAVQGFNGVANPYDNWRTALNSSAFNVFNHLRMAGNEKLFGNAILKGLAMAFSPDLLMKFGWPAKSVVEDLEFTILLLEQGHSVSYNPEAIITSEMAVTRKQADGQRKRWEGGRFAIARDMVPKLMKKILNGQFKYLFILADLLIAPLSLLVLLTLLSWFFAWILMPAAIAFPTAIFCMIFIYVVSGQLQRKAPLKLWIFLATFPLYLLWKIVIYFSMLVSPQSKVWSRTLRKSELK